MRDVGFLLAIVNIGGFGYLLTLVILQRRRLRLRWSQLNQSWRVLYETKQTIERAYLQGAAVAILTSDEWPKICEAHDNPRRAIAAWLYNYAHPNPVKEPA